VQFFNWMVTIVPIWFVGMTLYQRIYACRDEKTAQRAWFTAGLFEWPIMAFLGVSLGLLARVGADQGMFTYLGETDIAGMDPETGLPMLLRTALPVGVMGVVMSAYFSAILSTADSCLMAASGNVVSDILGRLVRLPGGNAHLRISQLATLLLGGAALLLATTMTEVLGMMLYSYAFMVSGLLIPVLGVVFWSGGTPAGAIAAMIGGGSTTVLLTQSQWALPWGLDPNVFGIAVSALAFFGISGLETMRQSEPIEG
jgi:SSS family solute:Na+ symporter